MCEGYLLVSLATAVVDIVTTAVAAAGGAGAAAGSAGDEGDSDAFFSAKYKRMRARFFFNP